jgi:tryptophan halogenase
MENARDFIFLHYMVERNDTAFWKDLKNVNAPDSLQEKLNLWKTRLPIREDFSGLSNYVLFTESHHALVLEGIGLVDRSAVMKKYDSLSAYTRQKADEIINWYDTQEELIPRISHKGALRLVRQSMGL